MKARLTSGLVLVGLAALTAVVAASAGGNKSAAVPSPAFSVEELTAFPGDNWVGWNGNIYNQRHSTLNQITAANAKSLKVAWRTTLIPPGLKAKQGPLGTFAEGQPVAYDGTLYMVDSSNNIWALNGDTGERIWLHRPKVPKGFAPVIPSRGVTIGDGKVYFANADATVTALNQATGRVAWKKTIANYKKGYYFTAASAYYDGKLFQGTSGGDSGAPAFFFALDAKTGRELWRFNVIPQKPSDPGWSSWPKTKAYNGGGAIWNTPAIDPELNQVYFVTGNPIPYSGNKRGAGDELFTETLVALDLRTGKLKWHFQMIKHDIWDYDPTNPVILFDIGNRKGIAHAGKTGWLYELDRRTGKPFIRGNIVNRKVDTIPGLNLSPVQPYVRGDNFAKLCPDFKAWKNAKLPGPKPRIGCIFEPYDEKRFTVFAPAALGGANWPPSSYNPQTGFVYICSKDTQAAWRAVPAEEQKLQALGDFSQIEGLAGMKGTPSAKSDGRLVAMNLRNNRIVWQHKWPNDMCYSGTMTTAGNLVFVGRNAGFLEAYNARTGALVWRSPKLKAGVNAPPMTYTANGKQYVAVFAGGNGIASLFGGVKPYYGASFYAFELPS